MELFEQVPVHIGKKKLFGAQLPFDAFVLRKYHKFHHRASKMNRRLVDAIGVDPIEELNFLFNGYSRMNEEQLKDGMASLSWSDESKQNAQEWAKESRDEKALLTLVRAGIHRYLRNHEVAQTLLKTKILDEPEPQDPYHEDWVRPVTYYELASNAWLQRTAYREIQGPGEADSQTIVKDAKTEDAHRPPFNLEYDREKVAECKHNLERVSNWKQYELHARFGIKVTFGLSTVERWEADHPVKS